MKYLEYLTIVLKHKWYVIVAGVKLKVPMSRLLLHDLSKFRPSEFFAYANKFCSKVSKGEDWYQTDCIKERIEKNFSIAWLHHQNRNDHHWQYWIRRGSVKELYEMPEECVREMIVDWKAAGKAYEGKWPDSTNWKWLDENINKLKLHPKTFGLVMKLTKE